MNDRSSELAAEIAQTGYKIRITTLWLQDAVAKGDRRDVCKAMMQLATAYKVSAMLMTRLVGTLKETNNDRTGK